MNRVALPTRLPVQPPTTGRPRPDGGGAHLAAYAACRVPAGPAPRPVRPPAPRSGLAVWERLSARCLRPEPLGRWRVAAARPAPTGLVLARLAVRSPSGPAAWRRAPADAPRADRPAWQSPYGPPSRRAHRGRWVPEPGVGKSLPAARPSYLCDRCD